MNKLSGKAELVVLRADVPSCYFANKPLKPIQQLSFRLNLSLNPHHESSRGLLKSARAMWVSWVRKQERQEDCPGGRKRTPSPPRVSQGMMTTGYAALHVVLGGTGT